MFLEWWFVSSVFKPGFVIYFSYGIKNSAEAMLASNGTEDDNSFDAGKPVSEINRPPTPEKEAFLHHQVNVNDGEDDSDSWGCY